MSVSKVRGNCCCLRSGARKFVANMMMHFQVPVMLTLDHRTRRAANQPSSCNGFPEEAEQDTRKQMLTGDKGNSSPISPR